MLLAIGLYACQSLEQSLILCKDPGSDIMTELLLQGKPELSYTEYIHD